jgi:hypothetical protein
MPFYPSRMPPKSAEPFRLVAIAILLTAILSALAIATAASCYFVWQQHELIVQQRDRQNLEQTHWAILNQAEAFKAEANYSACVQELQKLPEDSSFYLRIQRLSVECYDPLAQSWLNQAGNLAAEGKLKAAIHAALQISGGSFYAHAQQQIEAWSTQILEIAQQHYLDPSGQVDQAIEIARAIPEGSSLYGRSQAVINAWQQQWYADQHHWDAAQVALNAGNLAIAQQQAAQISEHPFWVSHRRETLLKVQEQEQAYEQILQQAAQQLAQGHPHAALQLIHQLPDFAPWSTQKLEIIQGAKSITHQRNWNTYLIALALVILLTVLLKTCFF